MISAKAMDFTEARLFNGSGLLKIAYLPCVVLFWVVCKRLGRYVDEERRPGLKFLEGTLKAALGVVVATLVAMGVFHVREAPVSPLFSLALWALSALWLLYPTFLPAYSTTRRATSQNRISQRYLR